jgi:hypothetical protein
MENGTKKQLTLAAARIAVKQFGYTLRNNDVDFCVWTGSDATSYYTDDLQDAVGTAEVMAAHRDKKTRLYCGHCKRTTTMSIEHRTYHCEKCGDTCGMVDSAVAKDLNGNVMTKANQQQKTEREVVMEAASKFPPQFGMRAFPGKVFRISIVASYITEGRVMLYTAVKTGEDKWECFCKGTVMELELEARLSAEDWQAGKGCGQHIAVRSGSCHNCAMLQPAEVR